VRNPELGSIRAPPRHSIVHGPVAEPAIASRLGPYNSTTRNALYELLDFRLGATLNAAVLRSWFCGKDFPDIALAAALAACALRKARDLRIRHRGTVGGFIFEQAMEAYERRTRP
jgi:hypothetical protein